MYLQLIPVKSLRINWFRLHGLAISIYRKESPLVYIFRLILGLSRLQIEYAHSRRKSVSPMTKTSTSIEFEVKE